MPSTVNCSGPSPSKAKSSTPDPIMSTPKSSKQQQRSRRRPQKPLVIFPSSSPTSLASRDHCTSAPAKTFQSRTSNMSQNISTTQSTPKSRRHHHRSVCSGSPSFFAASKMTESPHANDVPLPPSTWFTRTDAEEVSSICSDISALSLSSTESPTPDSCSVASDDSGFSASSFCGTRMDPMQLIAAVAAS